MKGQEVMQLIAAFLLWVKVPALQKLGLGWAESKISPTTRCHCDWCGYVIPMGQQNMLYSYT